MKPKEKKFTINSFVCRSRLIQSLPSNSYTIASQTVDIQVGDWGIILLAMHYHIKFPRYLKNKLEELRKWKDGKLWVLVVIEEESEKSKFGEVQMEVHGTNANVMPCFSVEEARQCL